MYESPRSAERAKQLIGNVALSSRHVKRGVIELAFLTVVYVGYSASRLLASNDFPAARGRAIELLNFEKTWRIAVEKPLNNFFAREDLVGVFGIGLVFYLMTPTAPPRLIDGAYIDVLSQHAQAGWWGADASAPRGLGGMTNELAAMPSLHASWALWVALVLIRARVRPIFRHISILYAVMTAIVIVGTGNHWVLDALAGWVVMGAGFAIVMAWEKRSPVIVHEELSLLLRTD